MSALKLQNIIQDETSDLNRRAERRDSKRIQFYRGEFPAAKIVVNGRTFDAEVFDISTQGIALIPSKEIPGLDTETSSVSIQLHNSSPRRGRLRSVTHTKFAGSFRLRLGLELEPDTLEQIDPAQRVTLSAIMPMAYSEDPIAFKQTMMFNVAYFAPNGLGLICKSEHSTIFPGLVLELSLMLPARGEYHAVIEVLSVQQHGDEYLLNGKWLNLSDELNNRVSEFILMSEKNFSILKLRDLGFSVRSLERAFVFGYAQTDEQMRRVLELRLRAAQADGRWLGETDCEKMRDPWDKFARQVYCEVDGRVVGAGRVVFNNGDHSRSEHEGNYKIEIPKWLWDEGFVEGSRLCTDPEFRGADVFTLMIQHISRIVLSSGHKFFVLNCVDNLVPVYRKTAGIKSLNKRFHTEYMQDRALNLLYADIRKLQLGLNLKASTWVINAPVGAHLIEQGVLKLKWWEKIPHLIASLAHRWVLSRYERLKLSKKPS
jgi:hypothetical protein